MAVWLVAAMCPCACSRQESAPSSAAKLAASATLPEAPAPKPNDVANSARAALFAADVPAGSLPLSLSIETLGGVSSVMFARGTALPAERREIFSTSTDDQPSVEITMYQGERPMAQDNRLIGKFQLTGIPPAARGVPRIEVSLRVDAHGVLNVSALDLATQATRAMTISSASEGLTKGQIDQVLADAAIHRNGDILQSQQSAARNELDTAIYSASKLLADSGPKIPPAPKRAAEQALNKARAVAADPTSNTGKLVAAKAALQKATHAVSEALYAR